MHGHVLLNLQWIAVGVVFSGLALEVIDSECEKRKKALTSHLVKQDALGAAPSDRESVALDLQVSPAVSAVSSGLGGSGAISRL